ncbi:fimbria/pilus outer membrane usher protein [Erwinia aphidicola]
MDDLYPTGYGGDISVTVRESDGRENQFTVPYAAIAQLVRPGMMLYSLTAGTLRNINLSRSEKVAQAKLQRGISNPLTGYGGLLSTRYYHALLLGGALGTPYGVLLQV